MGEKLFGATDEYNGVQFHFHAGSEHTIDGKRHDFEMHTVHLAKETLNDVGYAAVGIMFSVEEYTSNLSWAEQKVIDTFFDSVKMGEGSTTVADSNGKYLTNIDMVTYGDLMQMVDSNNRWVYKGSVTTPPCGRFVYWNVLSTIYPISQKHLDQFKARLNLGEGGQLDERGNWREIQKEDEHGVAYIMTGGKEDALT
jgi:carbonic anhydrase